MYVAVIEICFAGFLIPKGSHIVAGGKASTASATQPRYGSLVAGFARIRAPSTIQPKSGDSGYKEQPAQHEQETLNRVEARKLFQRPLRTCGVPQRMKRSYGALRPVQEGCSILVTAAEIRSTASPVRLLSSGISGPVAAIPASATA